jgi:IMP dehydrogenase/GMP reductase
MMAKKWHPTDASPGTHTVVAGAREIADRIVRAAERSQSETGRYVIPDAIALGITLGGAVRKTGEIRDRHPRGEDLRQAVLELVGFLQGACERLGARVVPEKPVRKKTSGKKTARRKRSGGKKSRTKR